MKHLRISSFIILSWIASINNAFTITTTLLSQSSSEPALKKLRWDVTIRTEPQPFYHQLSVRRKSDQDFDDGEDEEEDDDEPPEVGDVETFRFKNSHGGNSASSSSSSSSTPISFGYNKGRSSPTTRKAIGKSSSSIATIYLCTHCGSEYVQWMGRCPTCKEWNTIQEHVVSRATTPSGSSSSLRPMFGGGKSSAFTTNERPVGSWLDDLPSYNGGGGGGGANIGNVPIRITDLISSSSNSTTSTTINGDSTNHQRRIMIPDDDELNTVLGGGIMKGSLILLGGDPGVGKSTLALQIAGTIATQLSQPPLKIGMGKPSPSGTTASSNNGNLGPVWYVSGEENPDQIASRAMRLGIGTTSASSRETAPSELYLLRQTHVDSLCEQVVSHHMQPMHQHQHRSPSVSSDHDDDDDDDHDDASFSAQPPQSNLPISLLIIDSIQTMVCDAGGTSHAGGITQVRECVAMFLRLAKSINVPILLIGHVTKSGEVAGPRTVEHSTYQNNRFFVFSALKQ